MRTLSASLFASLLGLFLMQAANAATLGTFTHDYGIGKYDPAGSDVLGTDYVKVSDQSVARFSDSFDFSGLHYDSIDGFILTLGFKRAGPHLFTELWTVRIQGSDPSAASDDLFVPLFDKFSPQPVFVNVATDALTGGNSFAHSVATETFGFWFSEWTSGADAFKLDFATLTVKGVPTAVPLPATGLLLIGALGGIMGLRRRRKAAV